MGHNDERRQPRPRRKFSDEFKRDAVDLVLTTGRPIAEVAAELGVYDSTLGNWVRRHQERQQAGSDASPDERARLKELEAENAKLRMERDLLKRTVAFWVKESVRHEALLDRTEMQGLCPGAVAAAHEKLGAA